MKILVGLGEICGIAIEVGNPTQLKASEVIFRPAKLGAVCEELIFRCEAAYGDITRTAIAA